MAGRPVADAVRAEPSVKPHRHDPVTITMRHETFRMCTKCGARLEPQQLSIEEDYPASAWDVERHDYGPRDDRHREDGAT